MSIIQLRERERAIDRRQHEPAERPHRGGFRRRRKAAQDRSEHQHDEDCQWNEGSQKLEIDNAPGRNILVAWLRRDRWVDRDADNDVDNVRSGQEEARDNGDKVHFLTIYIEEAHPTDGWALPVNRDAGINYAQPTTTEERAEVAEVCAVRLDMKMPMLLGDIDNRVDMDYAAHPVRLFVIDEHGIVFHRSGMGPRDLDGALAAVEELAGRS